ncbi:MAG: transglycosylase SLT domain-containing protein [Epsilonproteobacteria bacterium]|nr:transglycosylase SLT domain-containing protein [Campylobacterota bacterium]
MKKTQQNKYMKFVASTVFTLFFGSASLQGGTLNDVLNTESGGDLLNDALNTASSSTGDITIPGLGTITAQCTMPSFSLPSADICSVLDSLDSHLDKLMSFTDNLNLDLGPCSLNVTSNMSGCQKQRLKSFCTSTLEEKEKEFSKALSGIGGYDQLASKKIALFGGKETFGENSSSTDPKRYVEIDSADNKKIYGKGGEIDKAVKDAGINMMNTRRLQRYLECKEASQKTGVSGDDCSLTGGRQYGNISESEIQAEIQTQGEAMVSKGSREISSTLEGRVDTFWPLYYEKSQAQGLGNWKMALAIGMHESRLRPDAVGARNSNGSQDFGIMQINNYAHQDVVLQRYPGHGTFSQTVSIASVGVDYGVTVFSDCVGKFGVTYEGINCYNKGAGRTYIRDGYVEKVQSEYAKIADRDFGVPSEPYVEDVYTTRTAANVFVVARNATRRHKMLTHMGQDTIDKLPPDARDKYKQIINRHMAQETLISAAYKKATDIEKALGKVSAFAYGME